MRLQRTGDVRVAGEMGEGQGVKSRGLPDVRHESKRLKLPHSYPLRERVEDEHSLTPLLDRRGNPGGVGWLIWTSTVAKTLVAAGTVGVNHPALAGTPPVREGNARGIVSHKRKPHRSVERWGFAGSCEPRKVPYSFAPSSAASDSSGVSLGPLASGVWLSPSASAWASAWTSVSAFFGFFLPFFVLKVSSPSFSSS